MRGLPRGSWRRRWRRRRKSVAHGLASVRCWYRRIYCAVHHCGCRRKRRRRLYNDQYRNSRIAWRNHKRQPEQRQSRFVRRRGWAGWWRRRKRHGWRRRQFQCRSVNLPWWARRSRQPQLKCLKRHADQHGSVRWWWWRRCCRYRVRTEGWRKRIPNFANAVYNPCSHRGRGSRYGHGWKWQQRRGVPAACCWRWGKRGRRC